MIANSNTHSTDPEITHAKCQGNISNPPSFLIPPRSFATANQPRPSPFTMDIDPNLILTTSRRSSTRGATAQEGAKREARKKLRVRHWEQRVTKFGSMTLLKWVPTAIEATPIESMIIDNVGQDDVEISHVNINRNIQKEAFTSVQVNAATVSQNENADPIVHIDKKPKIEESIEPQKITVVTASSEIQNDPKDGNNNATQNEPSDNAMMTDVAGTNALTSPEKDANQKKVEISNHAETQAKSSNVSDNQTEPVPVAEPLPVVHPTTPINSEVELKDGTSSSSINLDTHSTPTKVTEAIAEPSTPETAPSSPKATSGCPPEESSNSI